MIRVQSWYDSYDLELQTYFYDRPGEITNLNACLIHKPRSSSIKYKYKSEKTHKLNSPYLGSIPRLLEHIPTFSSISYIPCADEDDSDRVRGTPSQTGDL